MNRWIFAVFATAGLAGLGLAPAFAQDAGSPCPDFDADGLCDDVDPDDDGDGVADPLDLAPLDPWICADADSDGCDDCAVVGRTGAGPDPRNDGSDIDGDGVCDLADWDDDGDGVADDLDSHPQDPRRCVDLDGDRCDDCSVRAGDGSGGDVMRDGPDADADGICDATDPDDDNDGVVDTEDIAPTNPVQCRDLDDDSCDDCSLTGNDGSGGNPAADGPDIDGDGICDPGDLDLDLDDVVDADDLDDDGDGVPDVLEAGGFDPGADSDGDGILDFEDFDVWQNNPLGFCEDRDRNGRCDALPRVVDADQDRVPNHRDLDSDGDGISDVFEAGGLDLDLDGRLDECIDVSPRNGACDSVDASALPYPDTDGDGRPDAVDLDADGDGLTDAAESRRADANGDGLPDTYVDLDGNGYDDAGFVALPDLDGDGRWDGLDLDADADGIPDADEGFDVNGDGRADRAMLGRDADGDGLDDAVDPSEGGIEAPRPDRDLDGMVDACDRDADGDGIPDVIECAGGPTCPDTDGDGRADHLDLDSDGDGRPDLDEGHDLDANGVPDRGPWGLDGDLDGHDDAFGVDPPLADLDGDGVCNAYDLDDDGDGIPSRVEQLAEAVLQVDLDGDGHPADLDTDADGDGAPDAIEGVGDSDGDGAPDYLDADDVITTPTPGPGAGGGSCRDCPVDAGALDGGAARPPADAGGGDAPEAPAGCRTGDSEAFFWLALVLLGMALRGPRED